MQITSIIEFTDDYRDTSPEYAYKIARSALLLFNYIRRIASDIPCDLHHGIFSPRVRRLH